MMADSRTMTKAGEQLFEDLMRFKPAELSANGWAVRAGVSRTVWTDLRRHGNPSRRTLEKLLAAAQSSLAEFEALRVGAAVELVGADAAAGLGDASRGWRAAPPAPLPLIASETGGHWDVAERRIELTRMRPAQVIGRLPRPLSLVGDPDAYAVTIVADTMWPRFRVGRRIAVAPGTPAGIGDDVLVQLAEADGDGWMPVMIMELASPSAGSVELRQFNPAESATLAAGEFVAMHRIAGELF